jgi:hypothetical protein
MMDLAAQSPGLFIRANVLRERWNRRRGASVALGYDGEAAEVVLYAFDLLMFPGKDVRLWPSRGGGAVRQFV